jgi:hypothetical protein
MQQGGQSLSSYQWPNSLSRVAYFGQYPLIRQQRRRSRLVTKSAKGPQADSSGQQDR